MEANECKLCKTVSDIYSVHRSKDVDKLLFGTIRYNSEKVNFETFHEEAHGLCTWEIIHTFFINYNNHHLSRSSINKRVNKLYFIVIRHINFFKIEFKYKKCQIQ